MLVPGRCWHPWHGLVHLACLSGLRDEAMVVKDPSSVAAILDSLLRLLLLSHALQSELMTVYKVDVAFGDVMNKAEGQLRAWRQMVGSGKVVSDFGKKVPWSRAEYRVDCTSYGQS